MFMPQPGLPADPAAALAALRGQLSAGPRFLPGISGGGESLLWNPAGGGMTVDQPAALPPAVQAAVDRGEMSPTDALARVRANRPGFGTGQTPGIVPPQAGGGKPMAKPAARGGAPTGQVPPTGTFRQPKPAVEPPIPGAPPVSNDPADTAQALQQQLRLRTGMGTPTPAPEPPMQVQTGGGFQSGPLLPNGQAMQNVTAPEPDQGPVLPNGQRMGGQNPAYQGQMLGAMRSMFR